MATNKDPFGLSKRKGGAAPPALRRAPVTAADHKASFKGYIMIPPALLATLKYSTHVKYTKAEPDDKGPGHIFSGFVVKPNLVAQFRGKGPKRASVVLQNNFRKNSVTWLVPHDTVGRFYARADAVALGLHAEIIQVVKAIIGNVNSLSRRNNKLEARVRALEKRR